MMLQSQCLKVLIAVLMWHTLFQVGCKSNTPADDSTASDSKTVDSTISDNEPSKKLVAKNKLEVLEGTVLKKNWSKSSESWNAGGSDYFVLDTGNAPVKKKTADEGVLLIPGPEVTTELLEKHIGKRIQVSGNYTDGEVYQPSEEEQFMQRPVFDGVQLTMRRGAGFVAVKIVLLEGKQKQAP